VATPQLENGQKLLKQYRRRDGVDYHPLSTDVNQEQGDPLAWIAELEPPTAPKKPQKPEKKTAVPLLEDGRKIRIHPTLAREILNREQTVNGKPVDSVARLWLVLKGIGGDDNGGHIDYDVAARWLTRKSSPWYMFGKRQYKMLLARGEGALWHRRKTKDGELRIWLQSTVSIARLLDIERFRGKPIEITLSKIVPSAANFRAALYAAWIASRGEKATPLTRKVKEEITHCSKYRQRSYEQRAGVNVTRNYAIAGKYSDYQLERARHHDRRPAFKFIDYRGRYGRRMGEYVAWHLPNSDQAPRWCNVIRTRNTRFNNQLAVPCIYADGGNDKPQLERVFFGDGKAAANRRDPERDAYYPSMEGYKTQLWSVRSGASN